MVGKNPHRPEGKAGADNEHMRTAHSPSDASHGAKPSDKELYDMELEQKEAKGGASRIPAEESIGGSRPGVESRVKDAIERREDREAE